jgi:hypothetical protein
VTAGMLVPCPVCRFPKGKPAKPDIHAPSGSVPSGRFRTTGQGGLVAHESGFSGTGCGKKTLPVGCPARAASDLTPFPEVTT